MPDRRRHDDEDRGAGGARGETRPLAARPDRRLSAAPTRRWRRNGRGSPICATTSRAWRGGRRSLPGSARRSLPRWRTDRFRERRTLSVPDAPQVVLFADTFNRYFEPENIDAALAVLAAGRRHRHLPQPADCRLLRPHLLAVGLVDEARREAERCVAAARPGSPSGEFRVVGLGAELRARLPRRDPGVGQDRGGAVAGAVRGISPARRRRAGSNCRLAGEARLPRPRHQKAFGAMGAVEATPRCRTGRRGRRVELLRHGRAFGYHADTIDVSLKMAELSLLPAVRKAEPDTPVVADGTPAGTRSRTARPRGASCGARASDGPARGSGMN